MSHLCLADLFIDITVVPTFSKNIILLIIASSTVNSKLLVSNLFSILCFSFKAKFDLLNTINKDKLVKGNFYTLRVLQYNCYNLLELYENIDQILPNKFHGSIIHYKIGVTCVFNGHMFYTLVVIT